MSLSRSQWTTVAAALTTAAPAALWIAAATAGSSIPVAIGATIIAGVVWVIARIEHGHEITRQHNADTINGLAQCLADRLVEEIYAQVTSKLLEHREQADAAKAAVQHYRRLMGTGTENGPGSEPINLRAWRQDRNAP